MPYNAQMNSHTHVDEPLIIRFSAVYIGTSSIKPRCDSGGAPQLASPGLDAHTETPRLSITLLEARATESESYIRRPNYSHITSDFLLSLVSFGYLLLLWMPAQREDKKGLQRGSACLSCRWVDFS